MSENTTNDEDDFVVTSQVKTDRSTTHIVNEYFGEPIPFKHSIFENGKT